MRSGGVNPTSEHEALALYLLGALDDADRVTFEAHLAGCDECLVAAADLGSVTSGLGGLDEADWAEFALPPATVLPPGTAPEPSPPTGPEPVAATVAEPAGPAVREPIEPAVPEPAVPEPAVPEPAVRQPAAPDVGSSSVRVPESSPDPDGASAPDGGPVTTSRRLVRPGRGPGGSTGPSSAPGGGTRPGGTRPGGDRSPALSPRRRLLLWAGAVALAVAVLTGGIVATVGGGGGRDDLVLTATGEAPGQGVGLSVSITTHEGQGSTIRITATGLRPGLRYRLFAVTRDGVTHPVRDWTASTGPQEVTGELTPPVDQLSFVGVGLPDGTSVVTAPISR
ncbi:zf-HC2 domain-containing protein [Micromonospora sp. NBS 11-29]|uniref:zf-HC2 domain-containing protein n=1 Tax=Micromonospora sp. NBS 11-29 TaxID=1960879 RepID=UPI0026E370F1|nr:zf-HC2 domain-containing protein [Micromonospora sp. NBS 11-29]